MQKILVEETATSTTDNLSRTRAAYRSKAPVIIDGQALQKGEDAELAALKKARKDRYLASLSTQLPSAVIPAAPILHERRELKIQARFHYKKRNETKLPSAINNWNSVSKFLDLRPPTTTLS